MVRPFTSRYIRRTPTVVARTRRIIAAIYRDWPAKRGGKERTFDSARSRKGNIRERNWTIGSRKIIQVFESTCWTSGRSPKGKDRGLPCGQWKTCLLLFQQWQNVTTRSPHWLKSQRTLNCVSRQKSWQCRLSTLVTAPYTCKLRRSQYCCWRTQTLRSRDVSSEQRYVLTGMLLKLREYFLQAN